MQASSFSTTCPHLAVEVREIHLRFERDVAVGQNQWYHFGVGAPPILVYFSGDWDVHWVYGVLTHGRMLQCQTKRKAGWKPRHKSQKAGHNKPAGGQTKRKPPPERVL